MRTVVVLLASSVIVFTTLTDYQGAVNTHYGNAVVLLVQDSCAPCRKLENDIVPIMRQAGIMTDSSIHILSVSRDRELVSQLQGSELNKRRGLPVILVFRKVNGQQWGWRYMGYTESSKIVKWIIGIKKWKPQGKQ